MALSADDLRALLDDHGVTTVLIGAHAANRYRLEVRHTVDVDLLTSSLSGVAEILRVAGFVVREVLDDGHPYLLSARSGETVVDLLLAETAYQRLALSRAVGGVLTAEDVIVHKLIAGRPRDLDDIRSIMSTGISLDLPYIVEHARQWDVLVRWNDVSAGPPGA